MSPQIKKLYSFTLYCAFLFLLLFISQQTIASANATSSIISLDQWNSINLTPNSNYLIDKEEQLNFGDLPDANNWSNLRGEQFHFGMIRGKIWVKTLFQTQGSHAKQGFIVFNRKTDFIEARLYRNNQLENIYKLGAFQSLPIGKPGTNKNVIPIVLKPQSNYQLIVNFKSNYAITGTMALWEKEAYLNQDQIVLYGFIIYATTVLVIMLLNLSMYFATDYKAFIYHSTYVLNVLIFQVAHYGYFDALFSDHHLARKEMIMLLAGSIAYTSLILFIKLIAPHPKDTWLEKSVNLLLLVNFLVIVTSPLMHFQTTYMITTANGLAGAIIGGFHIAHYIKVKDPRVWMLSLTLFLFAPSLNLFGFNRMGLIQEHFLTEYLLMCVIAIEMLLISMLIFGRIREIRLTSWRSQFLDPDNQLPNIRALKKQIKTLQQKQIDFSLSYLWLSGLEKVEIAHGSQLATSYVQELTKMICSHPEIKMLQLDCKSSVTTTFYYEKNTLALITKPLNCFSQMQLKKTLDLLLRPIHQNHIDISLVVASSNTINNEKPSNYIIRNTRATLSQCLQKNLKVLLYNPEIGYTELRQITLLHDFRNAINQGQFYLEWQPQFNLKEQVSGLEALVRWSHPEYGTVPPANFIPLLEKNAKITRLSTWVMQQVVKEAPVFFSKNKQLDISINLSVCDLMQNNFIALVDKIFEKVTLEFKEKITLEVTESVHLEDNKLILDNIKALKQKGFKISIDDFGAGYASFSYLQTLPANELKIDQRYAKSCEEANSQAIIRGMIDLGLRLNMSIVVEGIETQKQQELFSQWGVHRLQGWRLGKPLIQKDIFAEVLS